MSARSKIKGLGNVGLSAMPSFSHRRAPLSNAKPKAQSPEVKSDNAIVRR
jgi:hypothetical protein